MEQDNHQLRSFTAPIFDNRVIDGNAVEELVDHNYHTQEFAKNNHYFVLNNLGSTPYSSIGLGFLLRRKSADLYSHFLTT